MQWKFANLKCYKGVKNRVRQRVIKTETEAESMPGGSSSLGKVS